MASTHYCSTSTIHRQTTIRLMSVKQTQDLDILESAALEEEVRLVPQAFSKPPSLSDISCFITNTYIMQCFQTEEQHAAFVNRKNVAMLTRKTE